MVAIGPACFTVKYLRFVKFYCILCNAQGKKQLFIAAVVTLWPSKNIFCEVISQSIKTLKVISDVSCIFTDISLS